MLDKKREEKRDFVYNRMSVKPHRGVKKGMEKNEKMLY
jgi:hypothetical protein